MPLLINLSQLETQHVHLAGQLSPAELELDNVDELIHFPHPLAYGFEAQKLENGILVSGWLRTRIRCECARCLKTFEHPVNMDPWTCHLTLDGEDNAAAVVKDAVDLLPYIREDVVLAFPAHPLCASDCRGLSNPWKGAPGSASESGADSPWAVLDKLKL